MSRRGYSSATVTFNFGNHRHFHAIWLLAAHYMLGAVPQPLPKIERAELADPQQAMTACACKPQVNWERNAPVGSRGAPCISIRGRRDRAGCRPQRSTGGKRVGCQSSVRCRSRMHSRGVAAICWHYFGSFCCRTALVRLCRMLMEQDHVKRRRPQARIHIPGAQRHRVTTARVEAHHVPR